MTDIIEPGGGDPAPEPAAAPDRLPAAGQSIVAQRAITAPATVDRAARTVEVVWSTGARARNFVPALGLITEELEMSPNAVRMAEAFVRTFKRDYVRVGDCADAQTVLRSLPAWFTHYNEVHPHRALGYRSPRQFIRAILTT